MNEDLLKIKSVDTEIGVGKAPISDEIVIVIKDSEHMNWIGLNENQVKELISNLQKLI